MYEYYDTDDHLHSKSFCRSFYCRVIVSCQLQKFDQNLDTTSVASKARMHAPEVQGGGAEMEQCSAGKLPETEEITDSMPMQTMEAVPTRCL